MKKHAWIIMLGAIILLIGVAFWYAGKASEKADEGVTVSEHIKGNPEAEVVLTEYSDFQCPACQAAAGIVAEVMDKYGDQIRFEYKHFPLITIHPQAVPAGVAAEAAGQQGKFWEMHDKLFAEQKVWSASPNPVVYFMQYATDIGLDITQFKRQLGSSILENEVRSGFKAAQALGFTGTPTFELNGEKMNFTSYEDFIGQIEAALGIGVAVEAPSADVIFGI